MVSAPNLHLLRRVSAINTPSPGPAGESSEAWVRLKAKRPSRCGVSRGGKVAVKRQAEPALTVFDGGEGEPRR